MVVYAPWELVDRIGIRWPVTGGVPFDDVDPIERLLYAQYLVWGIEDWIDAHSKHTITYDDGGLNKRSEEYDPGYGFGV